MHVSLQQNVDLRNYRKNILNFLGPRIAAINLFQVNLYKPWNDLWYCYEKAPLLPLPPYERVGGNAPVIPTLSGVTSSAGQ